jgi:hypothetical protein
VFASDRSLANSLWSAARFLIHWPGSGMARSGSRCSSAFSDSLSGGGSADRSGAKAWPGCLLRNSESAATARLRRSAVFAADRVGRVVVAGQFTVGPDRAGPAPPVQTACLVVRDRAERSGCPGLGVLGSVFIDALLAASMAAAISITYC